jgi:hypothetical protein
MYKFILVQILLLHICFFTKGQESNTRFVNFEKEIILSLYEINQLMNSNIYFTDSIICRTQILDNKLPIGGITPPPQMRNIIMNRVHPKFATYTDAQIKEGNIDPFITQTEITYIGKLLLNNNFNSFLFFVKKPSRIGTSPFNEVILMNCKDTNLTSLINISSYLCDGLTCCYTFTNILSANKLKYVFKFIGLDIGEFDAESKEEFSSGYLEISDEGYVKKPGNSNE